jgi:hypothetical protein
MNILQFVVDLILGAVAVGGALALKLWITDRLRPRGHSDPR